MQITVNGEKLEAAAIERERETARREHGDWTDAQIGERARDAVVEWALIRQEAVRFAPEPPADEVEAECKKLVESNGGKTEFFRRYNLTGRDEQRVRTDLAAQLRVTRFLGDLSSKVAAPDEAAIAAFFAEHATEFTEPEQRHVVHVVRHPRSQEDADKAYADLLAVRRRLLAGENFMEVAQKESECHDSSPDLGFFPRGQMVPEFEIVVFSMNIGEISPIFQTQFGFHIATVLERKDARPKTLDECR
ncbi:MAG: peptidylprolyl isomerase, partial [Kiritimatiellaeota bacterium]|nr:peptidylprolyl isomerase [Kiritimatiellota bacterium]